VGDILSCLFVCPCCFIPSAAAKLTQEMYRLLYKETFNIYLFGGEFCDLLKKKKGKELSLSECNNIAKIPSINRSGAACLYIHVIVMDAHK